MSQSLRKPSFRRSRPRSILASRMFWVVLLSPVASPRVFATVEVNVTHIGFAARSGQADAVGTDIVRRSAWAPVMVDLALTEQQPAFDGWLRVGQRDIDGDECYDRVEVHLRAETGGTQRVFLYIPPNPSRASEFIAVELFDQNGQAVQVVSQGEKTYRAMTALPPLAIEDNDLVLLEIATSTAGYVRSLVDETQSDRNARRVFAALTEPAGLPELWIGLEMVDYIVWENARPGDLSERQLGALIDWVRQGGTLLISASRTAGALAQTAALQDVLPVDIGPVVSVDDLFEVRKKLAGITYAGEADSDEDAEVVDDEPERGFKEKVPVVKAKVRPGAQVIAHEPTIASDVVTRRSLGRGQIIFCAITIKDLFSAPGVAHEFFRILFGVALRSNPGDVRPDDREVMFSTVMNTISFATSGTIYLFLAAVFSMAYIATATFGVWAFLGRRRWAQHNWTAFAAVAAAASVFSVLAVRSVHGIGETLHQVSIVDALAGENQGQGLALFGLKTSIDKRLDVWLPSDPLGEMEPGPTRCFLRPTPAGRGLAEQTTSFADPQDYRLVPGSAEIDEVRIRATLKRFQGVWQGPIGGRVDGTIHVRKVRERGENSDHEFWRIMDDSTVSNHLGFDLKDCYLLFTVENPGKDLRDQQTAAYAIGDLPAGGAPVSFGAACYARAMPGKVHELVKKHRLQEAHGEWSRRFIGVLSRLGEGLRNDVGYTLGSERDALFLLSTLGDFEYQDHSGMQSGLYGSYTWSRDRLRWLDLRNQLRRDQAVLIGFADVPGPIRLFRREGDRPYRKLDPSATRSRTMFRIRIPVMVDAPMGDREFLYREVARRDEP